MSLVTNSGDDAMVWARSKIEQEIDNGTIFVGTDENSKLSKDDIKFDHASMEVHLSADFRVWRSANRDDEPVDPHSENFEYRQHFQNNTISAQTETDGSFILKPEDFVLCEIHEFIRLPDNVFGSIESKSTLARLGISVHNAAPSIHPKYEGKLTLEMYNNSKRNIRLRPYRNNEDKGMLIAQIFFEDTTSANINDFTTIAKSIMDVSGRAAFLVKLAELFGGLSSIQAEINELITETETLDRVNQVERRSGTDG